jgi:hypothetical protein
MPALHNPADLSALPRVIAFALAVTAGWRAGNNEAERIATMPGPERAIGEAAGKPIGEDLRAVEIKHWQIHDHPDHLPDGIDYYSLYRLTTPERVFFFEATHRITRLPGDAIELDISVYPFDKVGNFVYIPCGNRANSPPPRSPISATSSPTTSGPIEKRCTRYTPPRNG